MKICYLSDLHIEFHGRRLLKDLKVPECDVLVVAGDLCPISDPVFDDCIEILKDKAPKIIYVAGNHEGYVEPVIQMVGTGEVRVSRPGDYTKLLERFEKLNTPDFITAAHYKCVELLGKKFHLGTLWFPKLEDTCEKFIDPGYVHKWPDFEWIPGISEDMIDAMNKDFYENIYRNLKKGDVVVTHHLPSYDSVPLKYRGTDNRFFLGGSYDHIILNRQLSLWIHGHSHEPCNYLLDKSRVVCNPCGYPWQLSPNWKPLVIEI